MRSALSVTLLALLLFAPSLAASSKRVSELQWIERRLAELQDDFGERLRHFEQRLDRDVKVIEEVERAMEGLDSLQAYAGVEIAIEHLGEAVKVALEEPPMPVELIDALRGGEKRARELRSNPAAEAREALRHQLHHTALDPANEIIREDVAEASEVTMRIRRSLVQTEEKLEQVMKLRTRLVVGGIMPKSF